MKYFLEGISSFIEEDHWEHGITKDTGCGLPWTPIAKKFNSKIEMLAWVDQNYNYKEFEEIEHNRMSTSKMVYDHTRHQNGGWFEPTEQEIKSWKEGVGKMWCETIDLFYHTFDDEFLIENTLNAIENFRQECEEKEYTSSDAAWDLLDLIKSNLEEML